MCPNTRCCPTVWSESAIAEKYYDPPTDQYHYQVRLPRLSLTLITRSPTPARGAFGPSLLHACPQGAIIYFGARPGPHRPDQSASSAASARRPAPIRPSSNSSACQEPLRHGPSARMSTARAQINYDKRVCCGCLVNCPLRRHLDKGSCSQRSTPSAAARPLSCPGLLGPVRREGHPGQIKAAMKRLGFAGLE